MSKHPYGPWTETQVNDVLVPGGLYTETNRLTGVKGILTHPANVLPRSLTRSGINTGNRAHSVPTSASLFRQDLKTKPWSASGTYTTLGDTYDFQTTGLWDTPGGSNFMSYANAENMAFQQLIKRQRRGSADKNSGKSTPLVVIGEFAKSVDTFKHLSNTLVGAHNEGYKLLVKNLAKFKRSSVKDLAHFASDHWLEYTFGIAPTISDINNLIADFHNVLTSGVRPQSHVRALYSDSASSSSILFPDTTCVVYCRRELTTTQKCVVKFGYKTRDEVLDKDIPLPEVLGLDIGQVIPTVWELTAYSWLSDYFLNLNDFFNLSSFHRNVVENGWRVIVNEVYASYIYTPVVHSVVNSGGIVTKFSSNSGYYVRSGFSFNRDPYDVSAFFPSLEFRHPNLLQSANIAALAGSRLIKPTKLLSSLFGNRGAAVNRLIRQG